MRSGLQKRVKYSDLFSVESLKYYQTHILDFVEDIIFQKDPTLYLTNHQKDLLLAIQNSRRISAKSGKGVGKTCGLALAIVWFATVFPNPKIICSAPTFPTLKTALWPEVALWLGKSLVKELFEHTEKRMYLIEDPKNWFVEPRTARTKESLQGIHAPNMLVVIDEASGITDEIFEPLDTTLTQRHNKIVLIGNPTQVSGPFFDSFNKYKTKWVNLTFNAEESDRVDKEQIEYYAEKYGVHHDLYLVNVKGEFPSGSPDAFIKLSDIHKAIQRWHDVEPRGDIEIGIDVARFGDDQTVLYWRQGFKVYPAKTLAKNTIIEAAQLVFDTIKEIRMRTGYDRKIKVKVDDSGIGGGVTDLLKEDRSHNIEVVACNFGGKGNDKYQNEASIMWSRVRDFINVIGLPDETHLIDELSARRWKLSMTGKIMIEPKSEFKKDFGNSPDRADALVLCFADKESERTVLRSFDPLDTNLIKSNLSYAGEDKFCSIHYAKDLLVSIIYTAWDGHRMYVYDEYVGDDPLIYICNDIILRQPFKRTYGNDRMFGNKTDDLATKFIKYKINITENFNYNETAAIESLSNLVAQKRLVINENCKKSITQLSQWVMTSSRIDQEREYGLCYALANMILDLKKKIERRDIPLVIPAYSEEKIKIVQSIENNFKVNNSWMMH